MFHTAIIIFFLLLPYLNNKDIIIFALIGRASVSLHGTWQNLPDRSCDETKEWRLFHGAAMSMDLTKWPLSFQTESSWIMLIMDSCLAPGVIHLYKPIWPQQRMAGCVLQFDKAHRKVIIKKPSAAVANIVQYAALCKCYS